MSVKTADTGAAVTGTPRHGNHRAPAVIVLLLCLVGSWGCSEQSDNNGESQGQTRPGPAARRARQADDKAAGRDDGSQGSATDGQERPLFSVSAQSPVGVIPEAASPLANRPDPAPEPQAPVVLAPASKPAPASLPDRTPEQKARSFVELARNYLNAGRADRAADFLNRVLTEFPRTQAAAQARDMLDAIQKKAGTSGGSP